MIFLLCLIFDIFGMSDIFVIQIFDIFVMSDITFSSCRPAARLHPAGLVRRPGRGDGDLFWGRLSCLLPGALPCPCLINDHDYLVTIIGTFLLGSTLGEACCQVLRDANSGELGEQRRDISPTLCQKGVLR